MNRERFDLLLEVLSKVDSKNFNISVWDCGTQACAAGHLMRDPRAKAAGLEPFFPWSAQAPVSGAPTFNGKTSYDALADFFGITDLDAVQLFSPTAYKRLDPSLQTVIRRVRSFMRSHL